MEKIIIVYGFEYENQIHPCNQMNSIVCKSINEKLPVYASPIIIEKYKINNICENIEEIETANKQELEKIDNMAKIRSLKPSWMVVLYNENMNFNGIGYESEGDENGDSR
jgi:hypothetical protein